MHKKASDHMLSLTGKPWNNLNRDVDVILYSGAVLTAGSNFDSAYDLTVKAETGTNDYIMGYWMLTLIMSRWASWARKTAAPLL